MGKLENRSRRRGREQRWAATGRLLERDRPCCELVSCMGLKKGRVGLKGRDADAVFFFIFIFFKIIFYRNIFSVSQFTSLYPYRPAYM